MQAQLVITAIQAGLRLAHTGEKIYAERTLDRALLLPLPDAPTLGADAALTFFTNTTIGQEIAGKEENIRIEQLIKRYINHGLSTEEDKEFLNLYLLALKEHRPEQYYAMVSNPDDVGSKAQLSNALSMDEMVALCSIRQWSRDELQASASPFKLIAGELVNIAVEYYLYTPEKINLNKPGGVALKSFLTTIETIDFAEEPPKKITSSLMLAVIDSDKEHPFLLGNTDTEQRLVKNVTKSLSQSAHKHLNNLTNTDEIEEASVWLPMIARAVIRGGTETIMNDPSAVFSTDNVHEEALVKNLTSSFAELVLGEDKLHFRRLFSGEGINTLVKSALAAVAENPMLIKSDNKGVQNVIVALAENLSEHDSLLRKDIFPDMARLVLEHSADNLDLLWPDASSHAEKHLLLITSKHLFRNVAANDDHWLHLNKKQLLNMAENIFGEVVENPNWLFENSDLADDAPLKIALEACMSALADYPPPRLSTDVAMFSISQGVKAAGMQLDFLKKLPPGGVDEGKTALAAAIDAIFDAAFGDQSEAGKKWHRSRQSTLKTALEIALAKLVKHGAEQPQIDVLRNHLGELIDQRIDTRELAQALEEKLKNV